MDRDVDPLRCHWKDGLRSVVTFGGEELAGEGITRGQCEIVSESSNKKNKGEKNLHDDF